MRIVAIIILAISFLTSCKEISFQQPQPSGINPLKEVPPALRGKYQTYDKQNGETGDTLIIEPWGYRMKDTKDKDWLGRGALSDSLVLKYYQGYYFVNFREGNQWVLRLIKEKSPGIYEFLQIDIQDDAKRSELLKKLSRKMKVKEFEKGDYTFYQINPTSKQLMTLINEGYFSGVELRKMN